MRDHVGRCGCDPLSLGDPQGLLRRMVYILDRSPWQPGGAGRGGEAVTGVTDVSAVELTEPLSDRKACRMNPRFLPGGPAGRVQKLQRKSGFRRGNDTFSLGTLSRRSLWRLEWCCHEAAQRASCNSRESRE